MAPAAKIKRALKSAARLPGRVAIGAGRSSGRNHFSPIAGEIPLVILRVQIIGCKDLLAKDRNGYSDPFVCASVLSTRHQTPVSKKTTSPDFPPRESTFDFPLYLSLADKLGVLELVVWDKDMFTKKDYLGEVALSLEEWFGMNEDGMGEKCKWGEEGNEPISLSLVSTRASTAATGTIQLKLGFVAPPNVQHDLDFAEVYSELVKRSRPSLVSAPPTEGVGTIRSNALGPEYEDDGGLSSDESDDEDEFVDASSGDLDSPPVLSGSGKLQASPQSTPGSFASLYTPPDTPGPDQNDQGRQLMERTGQGQQSKSQSLSQDMKKLKLAPPPELVLQPGSPDTPTNESPLGLGGKTPTPTPAGGTPTPTTATPNNVLTPRTATPNKTGGGFIPRMKFPRKLSGFTSSSPASPSPAPTTPTSELGSGPPVIAREQTGTPGEKEKKRLFRKSWSASGSSAGSGSGDSVPAGASGENNVGIGKNAVGYEFGASNDIVGIVMLEIQKADDLPRLKNMTRTGWDMDPFVVISFGKKVFRTRVIRHSRSPVWDEKLLFHVRRYETSFKVQLTILDWDKLSSNDHIGDVNFAVHELIENAPQPDPVTGLYAAEESGDHPMKEYSLPLSTAKEMPWEAKHNPVITFRAKYQPYDALRQRFWRQYLKQYDTDDTGSLSHLELTSMLDSLGSTLTRSTVASFFTRHNKRPHADEITIEEAIQCLETELGRPDSEKRRVDQDDGMDSSVSATPVLMVADSRGNELELEKLDFSGPTTLHGGAGAEGEPENSKPPALHGHETEPMQQPLSDAAVRPVIGDRQVSDSSSDDAEESSGNVSTSASNLQAPAATKKTRFKRVGRRNKNKKAISVKRSDSEESDDSIERVINVKNCPLCHRPRMNSKAEVDIVTHLAVCASQDWNKVDRIVVGNFVTASQAQRKWYTKIIGKISSGDYKLGANSANIIVQNRMTGQLEEEKMQVYVRLGIRLLYKGMKSRMEGGRARRLLKSLSIKQGVKYDDPASVRDILPFIEFHGLDVNEIQDPIDSFKNFNQFFYRKLKASARPVERPDDPYRLVSVADCRLMTFETVNEATRLWIKGREFTVTRLLGENYKGQAEKYAGGAVGIFRLAPQDYHRFHSPVDGTIGPMTYIAGEYYTVNPQAIRTALDVYGENARKIVPIDSPQFGRVMAVCVGAMMVGSIETTVQEGEQVNRGQEFGYFAFGGSTIVLLFEKGVLEWDEDLLINGRASLETLVRVGMGIGNGRRPAA
ncbi:phosphatidylserine decarboxylase-domain-containing protein [Crucibulum laeve]|uniref:Phosphatidylserine decarboxylase proenzyme 2 n=1 Tax=Crucibulum laeve TaxID=68775 RepID=A0A5C3LI66_9AGAR|nr:phosphatidylserine decarboxylase-domain-containing protein [Crucibulum laeve]